MRHLSLQSFLFAEAIQLQLVESFLHGLVPRFQKMQGEVFPRGFVMEDFRAFSGREAVVIEKDAHRVLGERWPV